MRGSLLLSHPGLWTRRHYSLTSYTGCCMRVRVVYTTNSSLQFQRQQIDDMRYDEDTSKITQLQ